MTADVMPRHCQRFNAKTGEWFRWTSSLGDHGRAKTDAAGLVTVPRVRIKAGE